MNRQAAFCLVGFVLVAAGAMPLNGYIFFHISPSEFYADGFNGSSLHLLVGLIPAVAGMAFLAIAYSHPLRMLLTFAIGILAGVAMAFSAIRRGPNQQAWLSWLAIVAVLVLAAALARTIRNIMTNKPASS